MLACPNFSDPTYKAISAIHGRKAVYMVHALLNHPEMRAKNARLTEDMSIEYAGGAISVGQVIEQYAPQLGREALEPFIRGQKNGSSAEAVLKRLSRGSDRTAEVAEKLIEMSRMLEGVTVEIDDTLDAEATYEYGDGFRRIRVSPNRFSTLPESRIREILLHEITHALTVHAVQQDGEFRSQMMGLHAIVKAAFPNEYAAQSVEEFVAEAVSNGEFQQKLLELNNGSFWERLLNTIRKWMGLDTGNSVIDAILKLDPTEVNTVGEGRFNFKMESNVSEEMEGATLEHKTEAYDRILRSLRRRIADLAKDQLNPESAVQKRKLESDLQIAMKSLENAERGKVITSAVSEAHNTLRDLLKQFGDKYRDKTLTVAFMEQAMKTATGIEDFVGPLRWLLINEPGTVEDPKAIVDALNSITTTIQTLREDEKEISIPMHARLLAKFDYRVERQYQTAYEKEFDSTHNRKDYRTKEEYRDEKARFVSQKMGDNKEEIEVAKRKRIAAELRLGAKDVGRFTAFARAFQDIGDDIIAMAKTVLDRTMDTVRTRYNPVEEKIAALYNALNDFKGRPSNHKKLYEDIVESSEEGETGYYVSEYRVGEFERAKEAFQVELAEIEDPKEKTRRWKQWYKDNYEQRYTDAWYKILEENSTEQPAEYEEISNHLRTILKAYKDGDGEYMYESIPDETWAEIRRLEGERAALKEKGSKVIGKLGKKTPNEAWKTLVAKKNAELSTEDFVAWVAMNKNDEGELLSIWTDFVPKDTKKYVNESYTGPGILKDKWKSKQYESLMAMPENSPVRQMYDYIMELQDNFDKFRPEGKRLGYRIPSMRKSNVEKLRAGEVSLAETKESLKQGFTLQEDDVEFGQVTEDSEGNLRNSVPIFFADKIDPKEMSFDIATVTARNAYHSMSYEEKMRVTPRLESLGRRIKEREVVVHDKKGRALKTAENTPHTMKGENTEVYKAYLNLLSKELYGIKKHDQKYVQAIEKVMGFTSAVMLGGNIRSAISNLTVGQLMANIEFYAGGDISRSAWQRAYAVYMGNIGGNLNDIGKGTKTGHINLLMHEFDGHNDFSGNRYDFARGGRAVRLLTDGSVVHGLTGTVEHFTQSLTLLGVLNDIKVMDADGDYITLSGAKTKDVSKAMSLYEAYNTDSGEAHLKDTVKQIRFDGRVWEWNAETKFRITQKSRGLNKKLHGAYSDQNRGEIYRHLWGRMIMSMRGWLFPQWDKRWRGFSRNALKGQSEEVMDWEVQDTFEGHYVTLVRLFGKLATEMDSVGLHVMAHYNTMSEKEKSNIKKSLMELSVIAGTTMLSLALQAAAKAGPDDDEEILYFAAYQMLRVRSEFAFFVYPPAMTDIVKDPISMVSTVNNGLKLMTQLTLQPNERYEAGRNKGKLKVRVQAERMIPIWRQFDSLFRNKEMINYFNF